MGKPMKWMAYNEAIESSALADDLKVHSLLYIPCTVKVHSLLYICMYTLSC